MISLLKSTASQFTERRIAPVFHQIETKTKRNLLFNGSVHISKKWVLEEHRDQRTGCVGE
jgi:hypothetical protein